MQVLTRYNKVIAYNENGYTPVGTSAICAVTNTCYHDVLIVNVDCVPTDIDSCEYYYINGKFVKGDDSAVRDLRKDVDRIKENGAEKFGGKSPDQFMGHDTKFKFMCGGGVDCNTLTDFGCYFVFNGRNNPSGAYFGFLQVHYYDGEGFDPGMGAATEVSRQEFTDWSSGKVYARCGYHVKGSSSWAWSQWVDLANNGQAEQDAKITQLQTDVVDARTVADFAWNGVRDIYDGAITLSNSNFTVVNDGIDLVGVPAGMYMVRVQVPEGIFSFMFDITPNQVTYSSIFGSTEPDSHGFISDAYCIKTTYIGSDEYALIVVRANNLDNNDDLTTDHRVSVCRIGTTHAAG